MSEAGIKPKRGWDGIEAEYEIKHLRKSAVTWLNDTEARRVLQPLRGGDDVERDELLSSLAIGHSDKVSRESYDFDEQRLVMAFQLLQVPNSFHHPISPAVANCGCSEHTPR